MLRPSFLFPASLLLFNCSRYGDHAGLRLFVWTSHHPVCDGKSCERRRPKLSRRPSPVHRGRLLQWTAVAGESGGGDLGSMRPRRLDHDRNHGKHRRCSPMHGRIDRHLYGLGFCSETRRCHVQSDHCLRRRMRSSHRHSAADLPVKRASSRVAEICSIRPTASARFGEIARAPIPRVWHRDENTPLLLSRFPCPRKSGSSTLLRQRQCFWPLALGKMRLRPTCY